ncbi:MAG: peptidoglycan-binding protein [Bacteroidetes bacterium]|nr:peptidoglycan-binding protein [Bacteroidota bacterium]
MQEWLNLHQFGLTIDGDFGRITEMSVSRFQEQNGIRSTGIVDDATWSVLIAPLRRVLTPLPTTVQQASFAEVVHLFARQHLREHPLEIGGANCGPWVRTYMKGNQGSPWAWCAGFVSFILKQAAETLQVTYNLAGSFSCDTLAAQGKNAGLFVPGASVINGSVSPQQLPVASIFLVRRTSTDWTHTGFVTEFQADGFSTIEGNTNDDGNRDGYEVCARTRGYGKIDLIALR